VENYKKQLVLLGAIPGGPHPAPGCLFHWITETGGGHEPGAAAKTYAHLLPDSADRARVVLDAYINQAAEAAERASR